MIRLFNGDCLEILKDISSNSVDLVICDLPFGCIGTSWDVSINLENFWKEIKRIRKDDHSPCLHFCTTRYGFELWESNKKEFRYDIVWSKSNGVGFLTANKMPLRSHEMIYVFSKAGSYYERIDISGNFPRAGGGRSGGQQVYGSSYETVQPDNEGKRCMKSVLECANKKTKGGHPTTKPVELYKLLIERYCPRGGTVLDPTFGSGNSGLACQELGRNYIGIEKDKGFFDKAKAKLISL